MVGRKLAQLLFGLDFHQVIEYVLSHEHRLFDPQGGQKFQRRRSRRYRFHGEIELNPVAPPVGQKQSAARVKTGLLAGPQMAVLP